jgi:hypothetical protein
VSGGPGADQLEVCDLAKRMYARRSVRPAPRTVTVSPDSLWMASARRPCTEVAGGLDLPSDERRAVVFDMMR